MFKKLVLLSSMVLAVPSLASATWYVNASASPSTAGTIKNAAGTSLVGTKSYADTVTSVDYYVAATGNNSITSVKSNGVNVTGAAGVYTITKKTGTQTVVAYFAQQAASVTTAVTGSGSVTPAFTTALNALKIGTNYDFNVTPANGYALESVKLDGVAQTVTNGVYTYTAAAGTHAITAKFNLVPVVNATISATGSMVAGQPVTVSATATTNDTAITGYAFKVNGVAVASTGATYTFSPAAGAYTVSVTATSTGGTIDTKSTSFTVISANQASVNTCTNCHSTRDAVVVSAYTAATAHNAANTCANCHTDNNDAVHPAAASSAKKCADCHAAENTEFTASQHWNTTANAGWHTPVEPTDPGLSCIYRCHFKATDYVAGSVPGDNTKGTGYGCSTCHGGTLTTGGSVTVANPDTNHKVLAATVDNTCYYCHSGSKHGWSVKAFEKSTHFTGEHAKLYYGGDTKKCLICHNEHNPEATMTNGFNDTCSNCHRPGSPYGIANADGTLRSVAFDANDHTTAPHGSGAYEATATGTAATQYVTQGAICADCHAHNNTINAGFAEGGHGKVSKEALNAWNHYDWSARTNNGTRQNGNCDRCHTAYGFIKFANQTTGFTRMRPVAGQPQNVLVCTACHKYLEGEGKPMPGLRIDATPAGNGQALSAGYFALFSSAAPTAAGTQGQVAADKTKIQIAFPGYKNSSICVPCHSGRSTAAVFTAVIDQANLVNKNYSTISTSYYQHAANVGQTFISQGAYDFTGKLAVITTNGPSAHAAVKMGTTDTQGPCVGCHYSETAKTHSLEVDHNSPSCIASACHATAPDVEAAKAEFDAGVAALDALIRVKFAPLQVVAGQDLATERANVRFGRFGKAAGVGADANTAKAAYGAWYNWQILATYDKAAWAHNPRYARQILNDTLAYLQVGSVPANKRFSGQNVADAIAAGVAAAAAQTPAVTVDAAAAQSFITAPGCSACHADKVSTYTTAAGYHFGSMKYACANCHSEKHNVTDAAQQPTCRCHGDVAGGATPVLTALNAADAKCNTCHATNDGHTMKGAAESGKVECLDCHDVAIQHPGKVADNNGGIRAISGEFTKRSHHIINADGSAPTSAQCAVCHLEGKADATGKVVMDSTYHMKDNKTYLRNVDAAGQAFVWDGNDHTAMDNFCFACHDANGASDTATLQAILPAATAKNPFADSLKNSYDQVVRAGVIDVKTAFTTTNASHHAVSGQRYQYKFSTLANAQAWAARTGNPVPDNSQIAEFHVGEESPNGGEIEAFDELEPMTGDFTLGSATPGEGDATLFEAGKFVAAYTPLGASESVADNSVLHCGDCHTVGQWKSGVNSQFDKVAIGAHGSNNEYMLRTNTGTDTLHNAVTYVCFNCHVGGLRDPNKHPSTAKTDVVGYATAHAVSAFHIQCQADSADNIGALDRLNSSWEPDKIKEYDYLPAAGATAALPGASTSASWAGVAKTGSDKGSGNITGIACTNCHNSGLRNGFGGIHGGDNTYTDGLGRSQKTYRFMPGMGNYRYAPPGGWDGKDVTDQRFVVQQSAANAALRGKPLGGCYTNGSVAGDANPGYSACNHHGTSTVANYGGGTSSNANTSTSLTWEPTVREATAGNALVTRPLKY